MLREYQVGTDPGGRGNFGLAVLGTSGGLICATVSSVDDAFKKVSPYGQTARLGH